MYLKIDTEVEKFELVFKGFERPFIFQITWIEFQIFAAVKAKLFL